MNKKILISLSLIAAVAAVVVGATTAYFSDTETSTGNTFTAGILDLTIDNHCSYNGYKCVSDGNDGYVWAGTDEPCYCTWEWDDLKKKAFFDFDDMKPGDWGEDTVSLHVTNDAWVCVDFSDLVDKENKCVEPEKKVDDSCGKDEGELSEKLFFKFWVDMCSPIINSDYGDAYPGDDIFSPECDEYLVRGYADEIFSNGPYILADSNYSIFGNGPLIESEEYFFGKVWCFGELGAKWVPGYGHIWTCDGELVDNLTQSDSLKVTIEFYAEQARNNLGFSCFSY